MKIVIIHNRYSRAGGEEGVIAFQRRLLESSGHTVIVYERSYDEIGQWRFGRFTSLFSALYNRRSVRDVGELVRYECPDVAIVHNLFPVISPAVLPVLRKAGVRVVMTLHNYRLVCPTGIFYTRGEICERCGSCTGREFNCLKNKCEGSWAGSFGYALRGWWSRVMDYYTKNVDCFLALSEFQGDILSRYMGVDVERFRVVPNCIDSAVMPEPSIKREAQDVGYVAYVGRLSPEKGIDLLFDVALQLPDVEFRVAGDLAAGMELPEVPSNVRMEGLLDKQQLADFYTDAQAVVVTSRCYEGFPLSVIEAMYYSTPVVVPNHAGLSEIVDYGKCGLLYDPGSVRELAARITELIDDPILSSRIGQKGRERVLTCYSSDVYYRLLLESISNA